MEPSRTETRRARARLVSVAMFDDALVLSLKPQLQGALLWVALIVSADAYGRTEGGPIVLLHTVLAGLDTNDWDEPTVSSLLQQMQDERDPGDGRGARSLIRWYRIGSRSHVELVNWTKTQHLTKPTAPERPAPQDSAELTALQARIATEIPKSTHNLHALASRMWKGGVKHPDQIVEAMRAVQKAGATIKNPWAYIQSKGFLGTSLSRGVESAGDREKQEERAGTRGGLETVGEVMRKIAAKEGDTT